MKAIAPLEKVSPGCVAWIAAIKALALNLRNRQAITSALHAQWLHLIATAVAVVVASNKQVTCWVRIGRKWSRADLFTRSCCTFCRANNGADATQSHNGEQSSYLSSASRLLSAVGTLSSRCIVLVVYVSAHSQQAGKPILERRIADGKLWHSWEASALAGSRSNLNRPTKCRSISVEV